MTIWLDPEKTHFDSPLSDLDPLVAGRLARLGLVTTAQVEGFLNPHKYQPAPASELTGLMAAADRLEAAIRKAEPICVWGDFDVDGQTSTTILVSMLRDLGAQVSFHIPVRGLESHGLNIPHLAPILASGAKLILTCDTGITSHAAIDHCNSCGVDVIITDHHDLPPELPRAAAITNPKFLPVDHPLANLSGAGVAYKLAEEMYARFGKKELIEKQLDLVALGLVADVAALQGDARYLVQLGLDALRNTTRLGLVSMFEAAELNPDHLTEEHIGFMIAPRLNALGRLEDANVSVELFTTSNPSRAKVLVTILEGLNARRQLLTSQVYQAAETQISQDASILQKNLILLNHPSWPAGILGIAASRLVDRYNRPVILISNPPGEPARGSARSIDGINISAAIAEYKDLLLNFGGHPMAAGLSMEFDRISEFREKLENTISARYAGRQMEPVIRLDRMFRLDELDMDLADTMEKLAPFGAGNPKPILATKNLSLVNLTRIGRQKEHAKFIVQDKDGNQQQVLWWNAGNESLPEGEFDLAYTLRASDWKGVRQVQMEFIDLRLSHQAQIPVVKPKLEMIDQRQNADPLGILKDLAEGSLVWLEGEERTTLTRRILEINYGLKVVDRNNLVRSDCLVLWTPPASLAVLQTAMQMVAPTRVILLKGSPLSMDPQAFINRLMGLVKFSLSQPEGRSSYAALAAATAQRETVIRSGLEWMSVQGMIEVTVEAGDRINIEKGDSRKDMEAAARCWSEIITLMEETRAYRAFFMTADKNMLIP
jgi:single-stranded-DNA-specific exonuclease